MTFSDKDEIRSKLKDELNKFLGKEETGYSDDTSLTKNLEMDLLDVVEFIMTVEDDLDVSIGDDDDFDTVGQLVDHIWSHYGIRNSGDTNS